MKRLLCLLLTLLLPACALAEAPVAIVSDSALSLPTRITHIPTGNSAEYEMGGDLFWTAFGDKLLCFQTGSEDRGSYWM